MIRLDDTLGMMKMMIDFDFVLMCMTMIIFDSLLFPRYAIGTDSTPRGS